MIASGSALGMHCLRHQCRASTSSCHAACTYRVLRQHSTSLARCRAIQRLPPAVLHSPGCTTATNTHISYTHINATRMPDLQLSPPYIQHTCASFIRALSCSNAAAHCLIYSNSRLCNTATILPAYYYSLPHIPPLSHEHEFMRRFAQEYTPSCGHHPTSSTPDHNPDYLMEKVRCRSMHSVYNGLLSQVAHVYPSTFMWSICSQYVGCTVNVVTYK